jgi:hypothetical protein
MPPDDGRMTETCCGNSIRGGEEEWTINCSINSIDVGHMGLMPAICEREVVSRWIPLRWPGFEPGSSHVLFVTDKVLLWVSRQSLHQLLRTYLLISPGAGTIGQTVANVQTRLGLTPTRNTKTNATVRGRKRLRFLVKNTEYCEIRFQGTSLVLHRSRQPNHKTNRRMITKRQWKESETHQRKLPQQTLSLYSRS